MQGKQNQHALTGAERELAMALGGLKPAADALDRDRIMFESGRRAANRRTRRGLAAATGVLLALNIGAWWVAVPSGDGAAADGVRLVEQPVEPAPSIEPPRDTPVVLVAERSEPKPTVLDRIIKPSNPATEMLESGVDEVVMSAPRPEARRPDEQLELIQRSLYPSGMELNRTIKVLNWLSPGDNE